MKGNLIISRNNGFYDIKNNLIKVNIDGNFNKVKNPYRITDLYIHGNKNNIEVIGKGKINHIKVFGNNNKIFINNNSTSQYNDRGVGNELIQKNNKYNNLNPIFSQNAYMPMPPFLINNNINYNNNFLNQNNDFNINEKKVDTILNNLEEKKFSEISIILKAENFNKCSLCKQMFLEDEKILIYSCKLHIFHKNCIKNWIRNHINSSSCPTCSINNNLNSNLNMNNNPFLIRPAPLQNPLLRMPHPFGNNNNNHSFNDNLDDNDYLYDDFDDLHINGYYDDDNDFDEYDDLNFEAKKGLSKIILNNMEISKMKNVEKLDTDKKKCTICLENYKNGDDSIALPCIHIFHAECIKTWLKNNTTCPICKNEIKYDEYEEVGGGGSLDDEFY